MNIAIVGSRDFTDLNMVKRFVESLPQGTTVISGGARGVDTAAEHTARSMGFPVRIHSAHWEEFGKRAGFLRNQDIVAEADLIVAFWDGTSKGTAHTIKLAESSGKPCMIVTI